MRDGMIDAVRGYLALLRSPPANHRLESLAAALDGLAAAYHSTPDVPCDDVLEPEDSTTDAQMRALATAAFPDFGFYTVVRPDEKPERWDQRPMTGDAIDDLADIARDMEQVERLWESGRAEDAGWQFRFGYRTHWGRHLQDLRSYVHARLHED